MINIPQVLTLRLPYSGNVPLPLAVLYWRRLIASDRGEYYFARHTRHAGAEMKAVASDIRTLLPMDELPHLGRLYAALERPTSMVG